MTDRRHGFAELRKGDGNPNWRGGSEERVKRKRATTLSWAKRNRERVNTRRRELYAANPDKHRERASYRVEAKVNVLRLNRTWSVKYRAQLRCEMISAYGRACSCCKESEPKFLQLDHVFNDGAEDRKINKTAAKLWASLKRIGWPKDRHQLLCANCNFGKLMNGGVCPHVG